MNFCQVSWEDEDKNRKVLFRVEYTTANGAVDVSAVTPESVTFLCPETQKPLRSIRLWGEKARTMLVRQFRESGRMDAIIQGLSDREFAASVA